MTISNTNWDVDLIAHPNASLCKEARRALEAGYPEDALIRGLRNGRVDCWGQAGRLSKLRLSEPNGGGLRFVPYRPPQRLRTLTA